MERVDEFMCAIGEMQPFVHAIEDLCWHPSQQRHPFVQCLPEIKLAVHRPRGDGRDLVAHTHLLAEFVDHLFIDERGIDIHHKQARHAESG